MVLVRGIVFVFTQGRPIHGDDAVDTSTGGERHDHVPPLRDVVARIERFFVDASGQSDEHHVSAVVLRRRAVVALERKEAVFGVEQIANPLASRCVVK